MKDFAVIDSLEAKGITPTMEELSRKLSEFSHRQNNAPRADFEGYSSFEMHNILHFTFGQNSPIQLNVLTPQEYEQIPIMRVVKRLSEIISQNGKIKLTAAGYLPVKIVQELYPFGVPDDLIESSLAKLSKEADCLPVHLARLLAQVSGILKNRKGILTLTARGAKIILDNSKLFDALFKGFCRGFNWGYFDYYSDDAKSGTIGQFGVGFTLILLSKYGKKERLDNFYAHKYFAAFPEILENIQPSYGTVQDYCTRCYSLRTFERFLYHFGLVHIKKAKPLTPLTLDETYIKTTPLFEKLVKVAPHKAFA